MVLMVMERFVGVFGAEKQNSDNLTHLLIWPKQTS
jgi:hypothetical protein